MNWLDLTIILVYLGLMLLFGMLFSKKNNTQEQFSVATGKIPGWALGISFYATFLSAITFIGDPGKSFTSNWNPFVFSLSMPLAAWVSVRYFVPFYRTHLSVSAYSHLESRFGAWARSYVMLCFILTQLARAGTIYYGISLTINALTGYEMQVIILFIGTCVIFYTVLGGMEAVIWTEVVQAIVKTLGALLILALILSKISFFEAIDIAYRQDKFSLGTMRVDWKQSSFWVVFLYGFFINLTNFGIDQNYIQRYHTAENTNDAGKSIWLCVAYFVPISALFFTLGTLLFVFYQLNPELIIPLKQQIASVKNIPLSHLQLTDYGDKVLPFFMKTQIPRGLLGLIIAALLSAAMSTISSGMNSSATVFLKDIYLPYFQKKFPTLQEITILKMVTIGIGILGVTFGIGMIGVKSLLDVWWKISGIFAGGMLGIFLLGLIGGNISAIFAKIATGLGVILIAWMSFKDIFPREFQFPFDSKLIVVLGTLSILGIGLLLQLASNIIRKS